MRATVALAKKHGVSIGAHPGFADRVNFGRREMSVTPIEASELVLRQIQAIQEIALKAGSFVRHVKLHGALYSMASKDRIFAEAVVSAVWVSEKNPVLFVLAGSELEKAARTHENIIVVSEVFADRSYQADGSLTPRSQSNALITDENVAVAQVLRMVREGKVRATDGTDVTIRADTVCLHGDGAHPVEFARRLRRELTAAGIEIKAYGA